MNKGRVLERKGKLALAKGEDLKQASMGCGGSKEAKKPRINVVLLGAGNCGKTTFIKQMMYEFKGGFDPSTSQGFVKDIQYNVLRCVGSALATGEIEVDEFHQKQVELVKGMHERFASKERWSVEVLMLQDHLVENKEALDALIAVSKMSTLMEYAEKHLSKEAEYLFLQDVDRIFREDYAPPKEHILRVRLPTIGKHDYEFDVGDLVLDITDVAGQKETRSTWLPVVAGADVVCYITSVADYKKKPDQKYTGHEESLDLFELLVEAQEMQNKLLFVLLNKTDKLYDQYFAKNPKDSIKDYNPKMDSPDSFIGYLDNEFSQLAKSVTEELNCEPVCSLDPDNFNKMFAILKREIIKNKLRSSGLM